MKLFLNQNLLKLNWVSKHLHSVVECNFHQAFPLETAISSALYQPWRNFQLNFVQFMRITYEIRYSHKWAYICIYGYDIHNLHLPRIPYRVEHWIASLSNLIPRFSKRQRVLRSLNLQAAVIVVYAFFLLFLCVKNLVWKANFPKKSILGL